MSEGTFRTQISEDIAYYQEQHPFLDSMANPDWAFNFWVLDKLYGEDDDVVKSHIIDNHDVGIDCYIWHEETKDLFLIQNKYYDDSSQLTASYFESNIDHAYQMLCDGTYKHCLELQQLFSAYRQHPDFYVYHCFYVTNNRRSDQVDIAVQNFNHKNANLNRRADVYYLDDIREAFYGEPNVDAKSFSTTVTTVVKGTILSTNPQDYGLDLEIDARYFMLPVTELYKLLRDANKAQYPIFDANIREYLGVGRAVNKGIKRTLESHSERKRFFFYNNGITIICSDLQVRKQSKKGRPVFLRNPQIVNGCQTVSTIHQVLSAYPESELEMEFKDVFVMAKALVIPDDDKEKTRFEELRKNIVRYNNSQNSIDEKSFNANEDFFRTVQREFEDKGFLVLLKQSDREKYSKKYKGDVETLRKLASKKIEQFGLEGRVRNLRDFMVPLDKLMQVILAFAGDSQQASQKKSALLKKDSTQWKLVTEAIQSDEFTTQRMLDLYLLYVRSEYEKSINQEDTRVPVTWHLIEGFSRYECAGGKYGEISAAISDRGTIDRLVMLYKLATASYLMDYEQDNPTRGYNDMVKEKLDLAKFDKSRKNAEMMVKMGMTAK
ncbi:MAG: AIPR family protein [Atopobiaceae bacterium]|nr:AIPR family protein [Atopobiaceae bacterium]